MTKAQQIAASLTEQQRAIIKTGSALIGGRLLVGELRQLLALRLVHGKVSADDGWKVKFLKLGEAVRQALQDKGDTLPSRLFHDGQEWIPAKAARAEARLSLIYRDAEEVFGRFRDDLGRAIADVPATHPARPKAEAAMKAMTDAEKAVNAWLEAMLPDTSNSSGAQE